MANVIACDLGSNTLRIVLWDCKNNRRLKEFERIVRTAQDLYKTGRISQSAIGRIFGALEAAKHQFDFKSTPTVCVTTQAIRQASNRFEVLDAIRSHFGLNFRIIDGQEEANLTRFGVEFGLGKCGIDTSSYVLIDLGGGSLEITCKSGMNIFSDSYPFGIVTLAEANKSAESFERSLKEKSSTIAKKVRSWPKVSRLVATAGTPTTLVAFKKGLDYRHYDASVVTGEELTKSECEESLNRLIKLPRDEQERWVGVGRIDLIIAGIKILTGIMDVFGFDKMTVVDEGLREGAAISFCSTLE